VKRFEKFFGSTANSLLAAVGSSDLREWLRDHRFGTVDTCRAASDQCDGDAVKRIGDARQSIPVYGSSSGVAIVTVQSDVSITLPGGGGTNAVPVELGAMHAFTALVSSSAHPDKSVVWSVSGAACPLLCGSVDASGNYTAPQILPASPNVTLTARSVADSSQQVSTAITITSNCLLQLAVPSSVAASTTATFIATLTPAPGSKPSTALSWSLSGSGCNGSSCGTLSVVTEQSAGGNTSAASASYTGPISSPAPNAIVVTVTPLADPSKAAQQQFSIQGATSGISVTVSPATATRAINYHLTLREARCLAGFA